MQVTAHILSFICVCNIACNHSFSGGFDSTAACLMREIAYCGSAGCIYKLLRENVNKNADEKILNTEVTKES